MEKYVLGVDIGSGSVKLTLLSKVGKIAATAGCEYPTHYPQVGWCEQDPEDWCSAFGTALAEILSAAAITAQQIDAMDALIHERSAVAGPFAPPGRLLVIGAVSVPTGILPVFFLFCNLFCLKIRPFFVFGKSGQKSACFVHFS